MFENIESVSYIIGVATVTIIAVLNPFGNLPLFIAMTEQVPIRLRQKLFRNILWVAFLIVLLFLFSGSFIMQYLFRVNLDSLRVAGGLVIGVMSLKNLLFSQTQQDFSNYKDLEFSELLKHSIIPMAFPMLVGPGTLSTVIIIAEESNMLIAAGAVVTAFVFLLILFYFSAMIEKILGHLVLYVLSRISLIFIVAVGIQMIVTGLQGMGVIKLP
ncbi:MarC family protein [uncultured Helicobacter sp.]|uniref:MarC family protein n=1 Tax=uncultured Helicobacter sp. TaxID=175537 RepID=UPI0026222C08|nr:MarC family protein [uncultured Helicobacter sp.]